MVNLILFSSTKNSLGNHQIPQIVECGVGLYEESYHFVLSDLVTSEDAQLHMQEDDILGNDADLTMAHSQDKSDAKGEVKVIFCFCHIEVLWLYAVM